MAMQAVKFAILAHGWVMVGRLIDENEECVVLKDACVVRRWGTKRGIGEIVKGPNPETILDPIPGETRFERAGILFTFSGDAEVWNTTLDKALVGPVEKGSG